MKIKKMTSLELKMMRATPVGGTVEIGGVSLRCERVPYVGKIKTSVASPCLGCVMFNPEEWGHDAQGKQLQCPCMTACMTPFRKDMESVKFTPVENL